jgi:fucose permease
MYNGKDTHKKERFQMKFLLMLVPVALLLVFMRISSGVLASGSAQLLNSLLWITILLGRFGCSAIGGRFAPASIIRVLSAGILIFLCLVLFTNSLPLMLAGTIGLGLSLSGMYGTTVANAGDVFGRYPLAMGIFVTLSGFGSIITPSVIGTVAESAGIRTGMRILLVPAAVLLIVAILNRAGGNRDSAGI